MKVTRIYHTWEKWECFTYDFYESKKKGLSKEDGEEIYRELLSSEEKFSEALELVINEWKHSCEHYLTNENMNRIAWLGQAALARMYKIPSSYRTGYFKLTKEEQKGADLVALKYLNKWLTSRGYEETDLLGAGVKARSNIY